MWLLSISCFCPFYMPTVFERSTNFFCSNLEITVTFCRQPRARCAHPWLVPVSLTARLINSWIFVASDSEYFYTFAYMLHASPKHIRYIYNGYLLLVKLNVCSALWAFYLFCTPFSMINISFLFKIVWSFNLYSLFSLLYRALHHGYFTQWFLQNREHKFPEGHALAS